MAFNIERLTIKDTFTNWRDKINGFIDIAVLAPMADENGVMYIDVPHCNAREVVFNVPVRMNEESTAASLECTTSFKSPKTVTTIQETADAGFKLTGKDNYIPWISGYTQNGIISIYTSSFDDSLHFAGLNLNGELVNTFSWDPVTNIVTATVSRAERADVADTATTFQVADLTNTTIPGAYPIFFGPVEGTAGSGAMDNSLTYQPRTGTLIAKNFQGNVVGNSATATKAEKLMNPRKLQLGQDATGYAIFDGTADVTIPCKLNATGVIAGFYGPSSNVNVPRTNRRFIVPAFRVDEKGRVTEAFTRTVEFPFPEVDVDTEFNASSPNPVANSLVAPRILNIESILERTPGMETATPSSNGLMSAADKTKLNGLSQFPRINSVGVQIFNGTTSTVASAVTKALSTTKYTQLTINAKNGLNSTVSVTDQQNSSLVTIDLSVELGELAGSGIISSNGKLTVPNYTGATSSAAGTAGLVPSATAAQRGLFLNGAGQWANPVGTTYNPATSSTNGLMSAADKAKLDGIAAQADNVTFTRSLSSGTKIGTITINGTATDIYGEKNTDTTYSNFTAATASAAGKSGLVPAPAKGAQAKFLRGDATWQAVYNASEIDTKINAINTTLNAKANLASPSLTGTPKAPTAAAGTNSTQIATTAFVNTKCGNYLPLTGGTLTGNILVKKSSPLMRSQDTRGVKGTAPSSNLWNQPYFILDNNGVAYGGIEHGFKTTRENRINMIVYPGTTNNTSTNAQIGVGYDGDGNWFTYAPTPAADDNSTKIATTAWVRRSSSMAPSTTTNGRSKNTTYTAGTNGWIRCWGGSGLNIGGRDYNNAFWSYTSHQNKTLIYPVAKGQQYYMYEGGGMQWIPAS